MADLLDKAHADAALNLLRADPGLTVYPSAEGVTPPAGTAVPPYVRVYATVSRPKPGPPALPGGGNALVGQSREITTSWYCHCVGANEDASLAIGMRVCRALLDVRPVISGRSCGLIRQTQVIAPHRDETTGVQLIDLVQVYSLVTT